MEKLMQHTSVKQRTLKAAINFNGIGLHSGVKIFMVIRPAKHCNGIWFHRKDVPFGKGLILARWFNIAESRLSTVLVNDHGTTIAMVEHLLAALQACGIDNAVIEVDGPELPIMDGSSAPFVDMIQRVGTVEQKVARQAIWVIRTIKVHQGDRYAVMMPANRQRITTSINFPGTAIGVQKLSMDRLDRVFGSELAGARTFGFAGEIESLHSLGLARGGSLMNTVLVDGMHIVNEEGLRYRDEFVRHKILDCVGDLSLAGAPILGHYCCHKPGHELNAAFLRHFFKNTDSWTYISFDNFNRLMGGDNTQDGGEHYKGEVLTVRYS